MSRSTKLLPLSILVLPFVACDNNVVARAEYDAVCRVPTDETGNH